MKIRIKKMYLETRIAFGKSGFPLSKRSDDDLLDLAIIARESNNPNLLILFDELPELDTLRKLKLGIKIAKNHERKQKPTPGNQ